MRQINAQLIKDFTKKDTELNGSGALERLAVKAKVSPTTLREMLREGYSADVRLGTATRLCEAMNVELDELFPRGNEEEGKAA